MQAWDEDKRHAILSTSTQGSYDRALGLEAEELAAFKDALNRYVRFYSFLAQVLPFVPAEWEVLFQFSKVLLKRVLGRYVPHSMVHRPKRGFGAPVSDWLKGDLRPWAEDLLQPARLEREGVLSAAAVQPLWQQFLGGQRKWHTHLWNVLMFQAWQAHWRQARTGVTGG